MPYTLIYHPDEDRYSFVDDGSVVFDEEDRKYKLIALYESKGWGLVLRENKPISGNEQDLHEKIRGKLIEQEEQKKKQKNAEAK